MSYNNYDKHNYAIFSLFLPILPLRWYVFVIMTTNPGGNSAAVTERVKMKQSFYDYCIQSDKQYLLDEWDTERNLPLTPQQVTYGSKKKVWWHCAQGHTWQSSIYVRMAGARCPYCAGRRILPGENDLASQYPHLAAQWHKTKNLPLTPQEISAGSHRAVWWQCEKGHEWRAVVRSRVSGAGCPVCANRVLSPGKNDLATLYPQLAKEWNYEKNGKLQPQDCIVGSSRRVWWKCEKGHEWRASIAGRTTGGRGCPVCAGRRIVPGENDLATAYPHLAAEWLQEKNGSLTPQSVSPYSNYKVWWRCPLGHEYQAKVDSRTKNSTGCPYCSGKKVLPGFNDLATVEPKLAAQFHPTLNGTLTPADFTPGSHQKVWWVCDEGHVWKAAVYSRTGSQRCGCPTCAGNTRKKRYR